MGRGTIRIVLTWDDDKVLSEIKQLRHQFKNPFLNIAPHHTQYTPYNIDCHTHNTINTNTTQIPTFTSILHTSTSILHTSTLQLYLTCLTMKSRVSPIKHLKGDQTSRRKDRSPGHSAVSMRKEEFNPTLYISSKFNQEDIIAIKEAFDSYDSNKTGLLTPNDLKVALFHQGFHASRQTVYNIIAQYDEDCLGGLNFQAFIKIIGGEPIEQQSESEVKKVFRRMDKQNKGYLDRRDVVNLLKSLGDQWDEQDIDVIFQRLDPRQNSRISFEQFKKIMHSPTSMY